MPRVRPNVLERDALADLWKHTLSRIPTLYGKLVYLASLRDKNSGSYRHHGLAAAFGRDESARALRLSHEEAFAEWLKLPVAEKAADLRSYLGGLEDSGEQVLDYWLSTGHTRHLVPDARHSSEQELFQRDLGILLQVFRNDPVLLARFPGSAQPE